MPTQQTRYAGPMVLKKIPKAQLDGLRGAVKAEGSKIVYVLIRVKEMHEPQHCPGMGGERKYTVWVCAKAAKQLSVCMWARQMGIHCLHADDIFPNTERMESEKLHAEAFHLAVREAKKQDELDYEEYASAPGMTCKKQPVSESVENDRLSYESKEEGTEGKSPRAAPDMDTQQGAVKSAPSTDTNTPPQKHPDNIDESLLFIFSNLRRYDDDYTELNTRSPVEAWKEMQQGALDVLRFQKKKARKETWLPTLAKAFKTHVYANDEWRKFADKRMEKARRKGEIADASQEGKAEAKEEFVESVQCDEGASKRQKCVDGDVTSALTVTARGGSKNKDEEGNEELLAYLLDQRRFDDGEELGSREAKDVWTHLQTCADRWYTSHMQEPRKAEHQMTLVRAMRGHPMRTDGWGGYALEHW